MGKRATKEVAAEVSALLSSLEQIRPSAPGAENEVPLNWSHLNPTLTPHAPSVTADPQVARQGDDHSQTTFPDAINLRWSCLSDCNETKAVEEVLARRSYGPIRTLQAQASWTLNLWQGNSPSFSK